MSRWIVLIVALWTLVLEPTFGVYEWMAESASPCPGQQEPSDRGEEPLGGWDAWLDQTLPQQNHDEAIAKAVQPMPVPLFTPTDWDGWTRASLKSCVAWYTPPPIWSVPYPPSDLPLRV